MYIRLMQRKVNGLSPPGHTWPNFVCPLSRDSPLEMLRIKAGKRTAKTTMFFMFKSKRNTRIIPKLNSPYVTIYTTQLQYGVKRRELWEAPHRAVLSATWKCGGNTWYKTKDARLGHCHTHRRCQHWYSVIQTLQLRHCCISQLITHSCNN